MFRGLFSQLVAIAVAVGIVITYIQPTFVKIGQTQDDIGVYRDEQVKVATVNSQLAALSNQINQIPELDKRALETYLPDAANIDNIAIPRDLEAMVEEAGARFGQATLLDSGSTDSEPVDRNLSAHVIELTFAGTYNQTKEFFTLLEQNNYPLEVHSLFIKPLDQGAFLDVTVSLMTYSYESLVTNN